MTNWNELLKRVDAFLVTIPGERRARELHEDISAYLNEKPHEPPPYKPVDVFAGIDRKTTDELRLPSPPHAAAEPEKPDIRQLAEGIWEALTIDEAAHSLRRAIALYASPSAQPIARDAERYRWLREQMVAENQPKRDQVQFEALYRVLDAADAETFDGIIDAAITSAGKESI